MDDRSYLEAFEKCTLETFCHRDHIRVAWIYLRTSTNEAAAGERMAASIRRFAAHNGAERKYHETMTVAWMRLVAAAVRQTPAVSSFDEFTALHPALLDADALERFYSRALLSCDAARVQWVDPDVQPLPE